MEIIKASFICIFLIFLLIDPCSSSGKMDLFKMDSEIYEIDYRGPETHTYIPPPKGSKGKHNFHHQNMMLKHHRKFKGLKVPEKFSGKKIHG
ncbi:uncharacterized protein LOC107001687 [Solanum pennellii]|uniref:Uncharacterized protein LOC107001687 n=1 Tax=Solanum pennellii TaxID=28526 RepID=A0ABM1FCX6_SOLPN|nr:uncharacterized protein LOC107001687 [Solanum pennellii]